MQSKWSIKCLVRFAVWTQFFLEVTGLCLDIKIQYCFKQVIWLSSASLAVFDAHERLWGMKIYSSRTLDKYVVNKTVEI